MALKITISPDKLTCFISFKSDAAQSTLSANDIRMQLAAAGIVATQEEAIEEAVRQIAQSGSISDLAVAFGDPCTPSQDGQIEWLFDPSVETQSVGKVDEHGRIDFRERRAFVEVQLGQLLARWTPPVQGTPGRDVQGHEIKIAQPNENRIMAGKNVVLSEDGSEAFAKIVGHAFVSGRRISVDRLYEINGDVNYKVGNVRYPGNVQISGDVLPDFKVEADGNIVISGVVDHAEIRAKGDILVRRGIVNGARAFAGGNLEARFIQDAHAECSGALIVADSIIQSTVAECESLTVTNRSGSRGILGGKINATSTISAYCIGSDIGVVTILRVGLNPKQMIEKRRFRTQLNDIENDMRRIEQFIESARKRNQPAAAIQKLESTLAARQQTARSVAQQIRAIDSSIDFRKAKITVYGIAHEGVELWFGEKTIKLDHSLQYTCFQYNEKSDEITATRL